MIVSTKILRAWWLPALLSLILCCDPSLLLAAPPEPSPVEMLSDAELADVFFVDKNHGWAVGDRGVIWGTEDGGQYWHRQRSRVTCRLESVFFLNPKQGWSVGGWTNPYTHKTEAVVLRTVDGGKNWALQRTMTLPALKRVKFFDERHGWALGNASVMYPAGIFRTSDGGRSWRPIPTSRTSGWLTGDFVDLRNGIVAGSDGKLARMVGNLLKTSRTPGLGLRHLTQLRISATGEGWLAGTGALVLRTRDSGVSWQLPTGRLPEGVIGLFDFHALAVYQQHIWVAGSPGTSVFHSGDGGKSWQRFFTGQSLPIKSLSFSDAKHGWAVGALGTILVTRDGGKTWQEQRSGGSRAALLGLFGEAKDVPLELFVQQSGSKGYLGAVEILNRRDVENSERRESPLSQRTHEALITVGASSAHTAWQFPLRQAGLKLSAQSIIDGWNRAHDGRGAANLEAEAVSLIRQWRPEVIVTAGAERKEGEPLDQLINQLVLSAVEKAADPTAYPEQITLGQLKPWTVKKVFGTTAKNRPSSFRIVTAQLAANLGRSLSDYAMPAHGLISVKRQPISDSIDFQLLVNRLPGEVGRSDFFSGLMLRAGGEARRLTGRTSAGNLETLRRLAQRQRNVQKLITKSADDPLGGVGWLGQVDDLTKGLPARSAGDILDRLARRYYETGRGELAAETLDLMIERYPQHPLSDAATAWLIQYYSSSEIALRLSKGTRLETFSGRTVAEPRKSLPSLPPAMKSRDPRQRRRPVATKKEEAPVQRASYNSKVQMQGGRNSASGATVSHRTRRAVVLGKIMEGNRPALFAEPALRFSLASAQRQQALGREADRFYHQLSAGRFESAWAACAQGELWLARPQGIPAKTIYNCALVEAKPILDGKLDDAIWKRAKTVKLKSTQRDDKPWPTTVKLAYDRKFLYLAVRCGKVPQVTYQTSKEPRPRDPDLQNHDRVDLLLDIDRDYASYYRLTVDHRGWVSEACFGDKGWNPKWFVAASDDPQSWTVEAAIPLSELASRPPSSHDAWAVGLQRTVPGVGFQSWTQPSAVRVVPEGFGLLLFD